MRPKFKREQLLYMREDEAGVTPVDEFRFTLVTLLLVLTVGIGWFSASDGAPSEFDPSLSVAHIAMLRQMHESVAYGELHEHDVQSYQTPDTECGAMRLIQKDAHSDGGYFYYEDHLLSNGEFCEFETDGQKAFRTMATFDRQQISTY